MPGAPSKALDWASLREMFAPPSSSPFSSLSSSSSSSFDSSFEAGAREAGSAAAVVERRVLPLGVPSIDRALPDGGLPRGAVVEIASPRGLGRATSFALAACASAQASARLRSGDERTVGAWCAFVDPWSTLHAAGVVRSGVDPSRLLVVRPTLDVLGADALARISVRVASSRAFSVVIIDTVSLPGAGELSSSAPQVVSPSGVGPSGVGPSGVAPPKRHVDLNRWGTIVRRLALAVERSDTTVLLLTDTLAHRAMPLPVAMRIELEHVQVFAEGIHGIAKTIESESPLASISTLRPRGASRGGGELLQGSLLQERLLQEDGERSSPRRISTHDSLARDAGLASGAGALSDRGALASELRSHVMLRIAKERRGRITEAVPVSFERDRRAAGERRAPFEEGRSELDPFEEGRSELDPFEQDPFGLEALVAASAHAEEARSR